MSSRMLADIEKSRNVSSETKVLINAIKTEFESFKLEIVKLINEKNADIDKLQKENETLRHELEEASMYSRRDCAIISGNAISSDAKPEDSSKLIISVLNKELKLNLTSSDISTAHRLGPKPFGPGQDSRKMIVELCWRHVKQNIMAAARK